MYDSSLLWKPRHMHKGTASVMSALQTPEMTCVLQGQRKRVWIAAPHLDVSIHANPFASLGQVT